MASITTSISVWLPVRLCIILMILVIIVRPVFSPVWSVGLLLSVLVVGLDTIWFWERIGVVLCVLRGILQMAMLQRVCNATPQYAEHARYRPTTAANAQVDTTTTAPANNASRHAQQAHTQMTSTCNASNANFPAVYATPHHACSVPHHTSYSMGIVIRSVLWVIFPIIVLVLNVRLLVRSVLVVSRVLSVWPGIMLILHPSVLCSVRLVIIRAMMHWLAMLFARSVLLSARPAYRYIIAHNVLLAITPSTAYA